MRWKMSLYVFALVGAVMTMMTAVSAQDNGAPPESSQPEAKPAQPTRIRIAGNVTAAKVVQRIQPVYPPSAKAAHVEGTVILHAIIARDGSVQKLELVSGPEQLVDAAMDAVRQWRYQPTLLNGQPVEVDTTIQIIFTLGSGQQTTPPAGGSVDPQVKKDALHLFEVMHLADRTAETERTVFQTLRPTILASLPQTPNREKIADAYGDKLTSLVRSEDFLDRMAEVYAKYLTDDDIKALGDFYQTPAGQHYYAVIPQLSGESMRIGEEVAAKNLANIFKELCQEYPELQGAASFCPKEHEKKSLFVPPGGRVLAASGWAGNGASLTRQ
ncbi:MAG: TonB family protein [Candidatus Acidiferrales bacterium]|jgi:TonB family protein